MSVGGKMVNHMDKVFILMLMAPLRQVYGETVNLLVMPVKKRDWVLILKPMESAFLSWWINKPYQIHKGCDIRVKTLAF